jgi:iron complex transport system substrate-binding protein
MVQCGYFLAKDGIKRLGALLLSLLLCACQPLVLAPPLDPDQAHLISHSQGQTVVPNHPQRLVTLGNASLETALALGIKPVGAAPWVAAGNQKQFPDFLPAAQLKGIEYLGDVNQPSLEKILRLKPDLILGNRGEHQAIYPILSQIAPTVLYDVLSLRWQESFRAYAAALNQAETAEAIVERYNSRIAKLQEHLGAELEMLQISIARFMPSQVRLYLKQSHIGQIMQDVGLKRPPAQDRDKWKEQLSLETIPRADGDILFLAQSDPQSLLYRQFTENPLWQHLKAVQCDRVYGVDFEYWIGGEGAIAANLILDDLFQWLVATPLPPCDRNTD